MRALIVPRAGMEPADHWYAFVCRRAEVGVVRGLGAAEVRPPAADDAADAEHLVLVGHQDAADAIGDFLASLPPGRRTAGVLLVAPPSADGDWGAGGCLRVLLSDDPGHEEAELAWEEHGAEVAIRPGGKRFYGRHEVSVLINLAALAMEIAEGGPAV